MIEGIDIAHHQGAIDIHRVAREGYAFVISKASEGVGYVDPRFDRHTRATMDAGLVPGAYHFARPDSIGDAADGEAEARAFAAAIKSVGLLGRTMLPPAIDFEKYSSNGPIETVIWIRAFVRILELELGVSPMIYTGRNVWKFEAGNTDEFAHLPLWLVRYSSKGLDPAEPPPELLGFGRPVLWQWSGSYSKDPKRNFAHGPKVAGVRCDLNRFTGDDWLDLVTPRIRPPWCELPPAEAWT